MISRIKTALKFWARCSRLGCCLAARFLHGDEVTASEVLVFTSDWVKRNWKPFGCINEDLSIMAFFIGPQTSLFTKRSLRFLIKFNNEMARIRRNVVINIKQIFSYLLKKICWEDFISFPFKSLQLTILLNFKPSKCSINILYSLKTKCTFVLL